DKIGAPPGDFGVAVGHLIPQAKSQRKIRLELDLILDIPGPLQSAEAKPRQKRDDGELCRTIGEECLQGRISDGRPSQRRRKPVALDALSPRPGAQGMFASDVVNIVGPGEGMSEKETGRTSRCSGRRE